MRTIKFRGKTELTGEWVYGFCSMGGSVRFEHQNQDERIVPRYLIDDGLLHDVIPETIGQFTGLTDRNGEEIYEGDIIRSTRNGFGGVVMWHKHGYFYISENIFEKEPGDYASLGHMLENHPYFEIVGNIHDNVPERLKGGDK